MDKAKVANIFFIPGFFERKWALFLAPFPWGEAFKNPKCVAIPLHLF